MRSFPRGGLHEYNLYVVVNVGQLYPVYVAVHKHIDVFTNAFYSKHTARIANGPITALSGVHSPPFFHEVYY